RAPRPTLLPYTTLFRSQADRPGRTAPPGLDPLARDHASVRGHGFQPERMGRPLARAHPQLVLAGHHFGFVAQPDRSPRPRPRAADRKSTRLNSSHVKIS